MNVNYGDLSHIYIVPQCTSPPLSRTNQCCTCFMDSPCSRCTSSVWFQSASDRRTSELAADQWGTGYNLHAQFSSVCVLARYRSPRQKALGDCCITRGEFTRTRALCRNTEPTDFFLHQLCTFMIIL